MDTFTIRAAAERCGVSYQAMRKRVDRRTVETVMSGGVRHIPQSELERAGLWPEPVKGDKELLAEVKRLREELQTHRALTERAQSAEAAEREARQRVEAAAIEDRARRLAAEQREGNLRTEAEAIASAGPIRALRLRKQLRESLREGA